MKIINKLFRGRTPGWKKELNKRIRWKNMSLQYKLVSIFAVTLLLIIGVNVVLFVNINFMMGRMEKIYVSNVNLDGLLGALEEVHSNMTEYLDTKSSDSLDAYYRSDQTFRDYLELFNSNTSSDEMLLSEKNITNLSMDYLKMVENTILAKRGRNVEQYSIYYEEACRKYDVVEKFIYSLNNARFRSNNKSYRVLLRSLSYLEIINVVLLILASVLAVFLIYLFTGTIISPLQELSNAAKQVSEGDFDVVVQPTDNEDEIGILSKTFAQMLDSIRRYVVQIRESIQKESAMKEKELMMEGQMKDAQLKYLQAQINPHFLFNSLNAGAQLAMLEGADKTTVFIDNMASFFRYNISKLEEDTTIDDELKMVDNYIYILNVRFAGDIHYEKKVDEDFGSIKVPSMIVQPLVENAVNYGIRDIDREKIIEISCTRTEEYIELSVWDNGKGVSKERIEEILSGNYEPDKASSHSNGVGLGNVMGRLSLYFGEDNLLDIRSEGEDMGTEVVIKIPMKYVDVDT